MLVRDATRADLPAIVEIYNHAITTTVATFDLEPFTVEQRLPWFAQFGAEHPLLVCEDQGAVIGFAYYLPYRDKPAYAATKETTLYTHREARRRGAGDRLYDELIDRARQAGVHALIAVLGGDNAASRGLHLKHGFVPVGHLRAVGYKFGAFVDTYYFEKLLVDDRGAQ
jgi:L-amino acid N-acyltransferase